MVTTAFPLANVSQTTASTAAPAATPKKSVINSDFNTFLIMLTTQIKNQDPTNPMDSADFAVQLATFSGVEQQVKTNDALAALSGQFGVMGMSQLATWVGQEARAPSPVYLGDNAVTLSYSTAIGADRAVISVKNEKGTVVAREDVTLGTGPYQWTGLAADGAPLPKGKYSISLESYRNGTQIGDASEVQAYSRIQEARSGANGTMLLLEGGIEVAATGVSALRVAEDGTPRTPPAPEAVPNRVMSAAQPNALRADQAAVPLNQQAQPEPETYKPD